MARWKDYTRKQTPSEADEVMLLDTDGKANKQNHTERAGKDNRKHRGISRCG